MRNSMILPALTLLFLASNLWAQSPSDVGTAPTDPPVRTWVTRQNAFNIPFSVSAAASNETPKSVELYVSQDEGTSWQLYRKQDASLRRFQFRAKGDGEFWFASRTVDSNRPAGRAGDLKPELRVVIDRDEPQLNFEAKVGPTGEIESHFSAADTTLAAGTLKVEYQPRVDQPWKPITIDQQRLKASADKLVGELRWRPETEMEAIPVRAEIADRAGNKSVVNRVVLLPSRNGGSRTSPHVAQGTVPSDPFRQLAENAILWPKDNQLRQPTRALPEKENAERFVKQVDESPGRTPEARQILSSIYSKTTAPDSGSPTPVATEFAKSTTAPPLLRRIPSLERELPPGETAKMTRSREFRLDYAIESAGSSGVRKVELWGTSDMGATWSNWKLDEDRQSPVDVSVEAEGIYGFRVVVVASNGLAGSVPRNGDPADLWVGVDTVLPSVRLTSAKYGDEQHFGQLDIRWDANDRWLGERPITLLFSDKPKGPWTTIRSGLPNTGQLYWPIEPRIPDKIYLRIEVRDQAGNTASHQLAEAIPISGLFPTARIRGILP